MSAPTPNKPDATAAGDVADSIKTTTCYRCACRCGIRVYLKNGTVRYIEGEPNHPVNKGVLCIQGSANCEAHNARRRRTHQPVSHLPRHHRRATDAAHGKQIPVAGNGFSDCAQTCPQSASDRVRQFVRPTDYSIGSGDVDKSYALSCGIHARGTLYSHWERVRTRTVLCRCSTRTATPITLPVPGFGSTTTAQGSGSRLISALKAQTTSSHMALT